MAWIPPVRIPAYLMIKDLGILTPADLEIIELHARVLTLPQCYDLIQVDSKSLSASDHFYSSAAHKKGLAKAINDACAELFSNMKKKGGGQPALEYLKSKQDNFRTVVATPNGSSGGFSFNVQLSE